MRLFAVLLAFVTGTVLGLRSAVWASCFFTWNDIFRPLAWARHAGPLGASWFYAVHYCTAVLAVAVFLRKWEHRWNQAAFALLMFVGWIFTSALFAVQIDVAMTQAIEAAKYLIPLVFITASLTTRWAQQIFLLTLAGSVGLWMAHHGLDCVLKGGAPEIFMAIPDGQMTDRNDFMVAGTGCIPLMAYVGWYYSGRWQSAIRWTARIALAFSFVALFLSLSRGAIIGITLLAVWFLFTTGRIGKRLVTVAVLGLCVMVLVPAVVWERMSTIEVGMEQTEMSASGRVEHMLTALKVTRDYPLTGCGPDNFVIVSTHYSQFDAEPHSIWLKCSAEYGLPMFAFFVLLVFSFLRQLHRAAREARRTADRQTEALALSLSCAIVGFLATGTFTSQFLSQYLWSIFALAGAFLASPRALADEAVGAPAKSTNVVPPLRTAASR